MTALMQTDAGVTAGGLAITGVSKAFGGVPVLHGVSLSAGKGTRTALVGASGSGKTTLLRLIAGFEGVDAGEIRLGERTLAAPGTSVPAHRRGIGYVAQDGALFPHLTVEQNIGFGLARRNGRTSRIREVMDLASLDPALAARYPDQLSGGQQQRVALARALAPGPAVILLDEPFNALDAGLREQTCHAVIDVLERSGVTAVLVTHDHTEAMSFAHEIGVLVSGCVEQSGVPAAVFDDPATPEVAALLGAAVLLDASRDGDHAECALGRIPVRHDRGDDHRDGRVLLRPAQLAVRPDSGSANAIVDAVWSRGSYTEVVVRAGGSPPIPVQVPAHDATAYYPGMSVAASVTGGCVLYPSL